MLCHSVGKGVIFVYVFCFLVYNSVLVVLNEFNFVFRHLGTLQKNGQYSSLLPLQERVIILQVHNKSERSFNLNAAIKVLSKHKEESRGEDKNRLFR